MRRDSEGISLILHHYLTKTLEVNRMKKLLKRLKPQHKGITPVVLPTNSSVVIESYGCSCACACQKANDDMQGNFDSNHGGNNS